MLFLGLLVFQQNGHTASHPKRIGNVIPILSTLIAGFVFGLAGLIGLQFGFMVRFVLSPDATTFTQTSLNLKLVYAVSLISFPIVIMFGFHF